MGHGTSVGRRGAISSTPTTCTTWSDSRSGAASPGRSNATLRPSCWSSEKSPREAITETLFPRRLKRRRAQALSRRLPLTPGLVLETSVYETSLARHRPAVAGSRPQLRNSRRHDPDCQGDGLWTCLARGLGLAQTANVTRGRARTSQNWDDRRQVATGHG